MILNGHEKQITTGENMKKLLFLTLLSLSSLCIAMQRDDVSRSTSSTSLSSGIRTTTTLDLSTPSSPQPPELDNLTPEQLATYLWVENDRLKSERDYYKFLCSNYKKIAEQAQIQVQNAKTSTQYRERAVAKAQVDNSKTTIELQTREINALKIQLKDKSAETMLLRRQINQLEENIRNLQQNEGSALTPEAAASTNVMQVVESDDESSGSDSDY